MCSHIVVSCILFCYPRSSFFCFFFNDPATTEIYTLSLHDALPITFVRAAALASALGPDLDSAVERLAGAPVAPARNTKTGGAWPYFAIPISGADWRERAEAIARSVAGDLRREAAIEAARWAELPCIVGSSSFSVGAWDEGGWAALEPSFEFASRLARAFGVR